jgi:hypothetical protein
MWHKQDLTFEGVTIMLDTNGLKRWCEDIVHSFVYSDFDSGSKVFRSKVSDCLQSMGILELCGSQQKRHALEKVIFANLQKQFHRWVEDSGRRRELIIWLEGFFVGANSVLQV